MQKNTAASDSRTKLLEQVSVPSRDELTTVLWLLSDSAEMTPIKYRLESIGIYPLEYPHSILTKDRSN